MSTWRKKALECLPENRKEFEDPNTSIYLVFSELLPALREAYLSRNTERIKKIYEFAAWCFKQKEKDFWNAAGVAFYEHLGDNEETLREIPNWVSKEIYEEIRVLLEMRLSKDKINWLDKMYLARKKNA